MPRRAKPRCGQPEYAGIFVEAVHRHEHRFRARRLPVRHGKPLAVAVDVVFIREAGGGDCRTGIQQLRRGTALHGQHRRQPGGAPASALTPVLLVHRVSGRSNQDTSALTSPCNTGKSSASNHGFFFSHAVLRQDGCGSGMTRTGASARYSRQLLTVSVRGAPAATGQVPGLSVHADGQHAFHLRHGGHQPVAPGRRAFRPRRQVAALVIKTREAEPHRHDGHPGCVVEDVFAPTPIQARSLSPDGSVKGLPEACTRVPGACPAISSRAVDDTCSTGLGSCGKGRLAGCGLIPAEAAGTGTRCDNVQVFAAHAFALGRADTASCQRFRMVWLSFICTLATRMKSMAHRASISATEKLSPAMNSLA